MSVAIPRSTQVTEESTLGDIVVGEKRKGSIRRQLLMGHELLTKDLDDRSKNLIS